MAELAREQLPAYLCGQNRQASKPVLGCVSKQTNEYPKRISIQVIHRPNKPVKWERKCKKINNQTSEK